MEVSKILSADVVDIIFDRRNKMYGAYELRTKYNKRLTTALVIMAILAGLIILLIFLSGFKKSDQLIIPEIREVKLVEVEKKPEEKIEIPSPPKPQQQQQQLQTEVYTPPRVVRDEEVSEDEKPPRVDDLANVKIGDFKQDGELDAGIAVPPVGDGGRGVVTAPQRTTDENDIFKKVEIESKYPGGPGAWARFLQRNLRFPDNAISDNIQGTVIVQFIVDRDGTVSDVIALTDPGGGLAEEAVRIVRKSGKWDPAIQNGKHVKSYKKQPITFRLAEE